MTNEPIDGVRNAEVVPLHPQREHPAPGPAPAAPAQVTYAVTPEAGAVRPVIPEHLRTLDGIRTAVGMHAARHWHRTRYHGLAVVC